MDRRQWKKAAVITVVVFVLVFAFWYGGDAQGLHGFSLSGSEKIERSHKGEEEIADSQAASSQTAVSEEENSKKALESEEKKSDDGNIFQQIFMKIKQTGHTSDQAAKTQNNKQAQKNANKAAKKSKKKKTANKKQKNQQETKTNPEDNDRTSEQAGTDTNSDIAQEHNNPDYTKESDTDVINCTISISCTVLLENMDRLKESKKKMVPSDGVILKATGVKIKKGSTVFDVLRDVTKANNIHLEYNFTPLYKSYYIEGIHNLYEFDGGDLSGWMYSINGEFPGVSCSSCKVEEGDVINWVYTCNLGKDVGGYFEE